jgi:inhibitor of cysteine peptidase
MLSRSYSMLALNEADTEKTIDVAAGDIIEIQLLENATAGYRWTLETIDKSVCEVIADGRHGPAKVIPGASGTHVWRLKATHAGNCRIEIAYRRAWQRDTPPTRTFKLGLRVHA